MNNGSSKKEGTELSQWIETQKTLLVELLHEMAKDLKYDKITHSDLALDAYIPGIYGTYFENSQREAECQKAVLKLVRGEVTIPISVSSSIDNALLDDKDLISEKIN